MRLATAAFLVGCVSTAAHGDMLKQTTAAEFLAKDRLYQLGFLAAHMEEASRTNDDKASQAKLSSCLVKSGITNGVLLDAVIHTIKTTPSLLTAEAFLAIWITTSDICKS